VIVKDRIFINGDWVAPQGPDVIEVISPVTEDVIARVPAGTKADVDRAVEAARLAFQRGAWPQMDAISRADVLEALGKQLLARGPEIAETITRQNGSPIAFSRASQSRSALLADFYAAIAREYPFEEQRIGITGLRSLVLRQPVGVVGAIAPWNAPMLLALLKVIPALAAGCTVVLKPAPETPLDAYLLAECLMEAGVPDGVVNIVAAGREVGEHLVTHAGVDKIAFTGSTAAGRRIASLCGTDLRRVTLELGGKSAAIVCDDADLDHAVPALVEASTLNNGQGCSNQTRILVSRAREAELTDALIAGYTALTIGDPLEETTDIGPLVAERQQSRVKGYIESGIAEGAKVAFGGGRPASHSKGWYVEPTIFVNVDNGMRIAQEEIFGPVVAVIPYDSLDEAIALANDSQYGLSGTVWSQDPDRAVDIARQIRTGTSVINGFTYDFNNPMGGFKASGWGREMGPEGLDSYIEFHTIAQPATDVGQNGAAER
jgi:aldehyde dehydrogenase (NAD+)